MRIAATLPPSAALQRLHDLNFSSVLICCAANLSLGLQLCKSLRETDASRNVPIILWSPGSSGSERLSALQAGADEVLAAEHLTGECCYRVATAVRRRSCARSVNLFSVGDFSVDADSYLLKRGAAKIDLTGFQLKLLLTLMRMPDKVFSYGDLARLVWEEESITPNTIKTTVVRLRDRLERVGALSTIKNVHGVGYALKVESHTN